MNRRIVHFTLTTFAIIAFFQARLTAQPSAEGVAKQILDATGVKGGIIVHLGCGDGRLTAALRANESYLVHGLDPDPKNVEAARAHIQSLGLYGKVFVEVWRGGALPYIDNMVNLLLASNESLAPSEEVMRVLAPNGAAYVQKDGQWVKTVKPRPREIDEWTHYLHDPSNNAVAHDSVIAPLTRFQWIGSPRYSRQHDHMSAISAMVSANGRVFYIFDEAPRPSILIPPQWYLTARDAFNGAVLWRRRIQRWHEHLWPLKSGPQILTRRLVAVGDRVYVTLNIDDPLSALDAATGQTVRTYEGTQTTEEILYDNGVLYLSVAAPGQPLRSDPKKSFATLADIRAAVTDPIWTDAPRTIMAVEADSGKILWKKESVVVAMSLAAKDNRVFFHDGQKIQCLDARNGASLWASEPLPRRPGMRSSGGVTLVAYEDVILYNGQVPAPDSSPGRKRDPGATMLYALSAKDGKTLWKAEQSPCGHVETPRDILVINGVVWYGAVAQGSDSGIMTGRDVHTGKVIKEFPPDVETHWFHHRCYRAKATDKYLLFSRTGIEFIDPAAKHWTCHHWVRGGCLYGVMPCNGLIYNPPHPCACYIEAKLFGFHALAPDAPSKPRLRDAKEEGLLERGPAFEAISDVKSQMADEWPTYRHDSARSGATKSEVPTNLKLTWQAPLGGRLSALTVADGRVYVSQVDAHTLCALDANSGKALWTFTAGGRVDSPPTLWQGRVLFGCADGWVYCLRATDGQLAWRYLAAPADRRMGAFEQVESVWPVHGSVLIQNDILYCVAGRSMFLDGGLRLLRLDPKTGRKLSETVLDDRDPAANANLQVHIKGLNMPVALPDILSSDGRYVYMRSLPFDLQGQRKMVGYVEVRDREGDDVHLFSPTGFLDDTMWHRTYWVYGRAFASGAGGYYLAGRIVPAGRMLVFDDKMVYGYGRRWQFYRWTTPLEYHIFAAPKSPEIIRMGTEPRMGAKKDPKTGKAAKSPVTRFGWTWSNEATIQVTAMALAAQSLFVAGPPDLVDEEQAIKALNVPEVQKALAEQEAAFEGRKGALLAAVSPADGRALAAYRLDSAPVFDGMAAAGGRLYLSTTDGKVLCLGSEGQPLASVPETVLKLRPPEADRPAPPPAGEGITTTHPDFQHLEAVRISPSELGYRLEAQENQTGIALKKLAAPLTQQATFKLKMKPTEAEGRLVMGFLAFGENPSNDRLVKCGVRVRAKKALIIEGPIGKGGKMTSESFECTPNQLLELEATVDLKRQRVSMSLPGKSLQAPLQKPLKSIVYVGYCLQDAVTEFSPISIRGE